MAIHGFVDQNGSVQKYDYESLENVPTDLVKDEDLDIVIAVQDTEPEEEKTKLWIKETATGGVQVPTYDEFLETKEDTNDLKSAIYKHQIVNPGMVFTKGYINTTTGAPAGGSSSKSCRSDWLDCTEKKYTIAVGEGNRVDVFYYRSADVAEFVETSGAITDTYAIKKGFFVRIVAALVSGESMTVAQALVSFTVYQNAVSDPDEDTLKALLNCNGEAIPYKIASNSTYVNALTGDTGTYDPFARTYLVDIEAFDYIIYSNVYTNFHSFPGGMAFYSLNDVSSFISGVVSDVGAESGNSYKTKFVRVPVGAKYARFTLVKDADGFFIKGLRKKPLSGLRLSLLGDSMSAGDSSTPSGPMSTTAGGLYIPEGNTVYYNGNRGGVKNITEMWWKRVCDGTGMQPLVIDAWGASCICYNCAQNDPDHSSDTRIPMCSTLRTGRLDKDGNSPDVIIVIGGTNDWTLAAPATAEYPATTPLGDWNGHDAISEEDVDNGESTFMESYAVMIKRLQHNYPNAVIVCATLFKVAGRGTSNGIVKLNNVGNTITDYSNAIERVCKIMNVPFINISNVGFNDENYYPTYSEDSATNPLHLNSLGQSVIARRFIEELPRLVKQFKN